MNAVQLSEGSALERVEPASEAPIPTTGSPEAQDPRALSALTCAVPATRISLPGDVWASDLPSCPRAALSRQSGATAVRSAQPTGAVREPADIPKAVRRSTPPISESENGSAMVIRKYG
jgi:hypothetical protein